MLIRIITLIIIVIGVRIIMRIIRIGFITIISIIFRQSFRADGCLAGVVEGPPSG